MSSKHEDIPFSFEILGLSDSSSLPGESCSEGHAVALWHFTVSDRNLRADISVLDTAFDNAVLLERKRHTPMAQEKKKSSVPRRTEDSLVLDVSAALE